MQSQVTSVIGDKCTGWVLDENTRGGEKFVERKRRDSSNLNWRSGDDNILRVVGLQLRTPAIDNHQSEPDRPRDGCQLTLFH